MHFARRQESAASGVPARHGGRVSERLLPYPAA